MYITNRPEVALIAEDAGVDRIFVDMEYIGKAARQGGMDTVQSHHSIEDVKTLRATITKAELLVRVNPIHDATEEATSSETEIEQVIEAGADIIMLPFFQNASQVRRFLQAVHRRCKTILLFETPEAIANLQEILALPDIDEVYIGLNDLSLGYGKRFMFELLADGTVERIALAFREKNLTFGFGGIAAIGTGTLPAEAILKEHYRLGSSMVILSRSFCDSSKVTDMDILRETFCTGIGAMRAYEKEIVPHSSYFSQNQRFVQQCVQKILASMAK